MENFPKKRKPKSRVTLLLFFLLQLLPLLQRPSAGGHQAALADVNERSVEVFFWVDGFVVKQGGLCGSDGVFVCFFYFS